jgi:hypothetical protein
MYGKLTKMTKSGQADKQFTYRQKWVLANFKFLEAHLKVQTKTRTLGASTVSRTSEAVEDELDEEEPEAEEELEAETLVALPTASTSTTTATSGQRPTKRKKGGRAQVDAYIRTIAEKMSGTANLQAMVTLFLHFMIIFS